MSEGDNGELVRVLREIRDNQKLQLESQQEALVLQREQFATFQKQAERYERIQDRAERLQEKSSQVVSIARKSLAIVLPVAIVLVLYISWLIFR